MVLIFLFVRILSSTQDHAVLGGIWAKSGVVFQHISQRWKSTTEETESCMNLNFSTFEWYVTKKVSVCEMAFWTGVKYQVSTSQRCWECWEIVEKYFAHIPPTAFITQSSWVFNFHMTTLGPRWSYGNDLNHSCTSFEGASRGGQPLIILRWFIGAGRPGLPIRNYSGIRWSVTVLYTCVHTWTQYMWMRINFLSVCIWFQNWAHLVPNAGSRINFWTTFPDSHF